MSAPTARSSRVRSVKPSQPRQNKMAMYRADNVEYLLQIISPKNYAEFSDEIDALDLFSKYLSLLGDETNNCVIFNKFSFSNLRVFTLT